MQQYGNAATASRAYADIELTIKHYAGEVTYASRGFREKNKDALHPDLAGVMQARTIIQ